MEIKTFFFDTYAFYEIIEGNENYRAYAKNVAIVTTKLNLMELHYGLLIQYGKKEAERYFDGLSKFAIEISDEMIKKANEFRALLKKKSLSYVDCVGYVIVKSRNIKFLTGDKEFEGLDNVEFVK